MRNIQNVVVELHSASSMSISCELNGDRYHVWLHPVTHQPSDSRGGRVLYKNPPAHCSSHKSPGYYPTRKLSLDADFGREMLMHMICVANEVGLFKKAVAKRAADDAAYFARVEAIGKRPTQEELFLFIKKLAATNHLAGDTHEAIALICEREAAACKALYEEAQIRTAEGRAT